MKKFQPVLDIFYIILIYAWLCFNIIVLHQILSESDVSIPTVIVAVNNILFIVVYVILIRVQIINILEAIKTEDIDYCINNDFFYKYTLMPIMLIGRGLPVYICLFGVGAFFLVFLLPFVIITWPFIIGMWILLPVLLVCTTVIELPCFILTICILDITRKQKKMTFERSSMHFILQLIPGIDLIDGLHISTKYWNKGRMLARITLICVAVSILIGILIDLFSRFVK